MALSCQSVEETIAGILARRPVLGPVLNMFAPLLTARAALPQTLRPLLEETTLRLPEMDRERAAQGFPLLAEQPLTGIAAPLRAAAETILPLLEAQTVTRPHMDGLRRMFAVPQEEDAARERTAALEVLAEGMLNEKTAVLEKAAADAGVPLPVLLFAFGFILGPVLRALVLMRPGGDGKDAPWNADGAWRHGYCPVCGSSPSIAYLDRPVFDEKNAFLAGGGGKKHLHCSLCGTDWVFRRGACPFCEKEGNDVMEILRETKDARGERVDWCTQCRTYCPAVDLRESTGTPDMDVQAIGMLHLDMVAAGKGLHPIHPAFWNTF
ncbi:formate dehydrogenase accessory protein FdhE [uncultured Desulfovibrio sp.]|uniref:formate dehydrogenase accessory protein FdhE n=1 Tax=uncultured Desulfovibrio sp. TaxID=167968 RepID=UPI0026258AAD|nr:formate dehydrogenase accessory protein FdhE [uncultured Desulfovibrio sp.]